MCEGGRILLMIIKISTNHVFFFRFVVRRGCVCIFLFFVVSKRTSVKCGTLLQCGDYASINIH